MINIGGYVPGLKFRLNSEFTNPKILSYASSGVSTGNIIDASYSDYIYSGIITGTQYLITPVIEKIGLYGETPIITLNTDNSGVATIDNNGNTFFISTGNFNVIGAYGANSFYNGLDIFLPLINYSGGGVSTTERYLSGNNIDISKHILIVYNSNSNNSLNVKNYYTGTRPNFYLANILNISCNSGERITYDDYVNTIQTPIINYLTGVSGTKPIRYLIMMPDIPTRLSGAGPSERSVSYHLYYAYKNLNLRNGSEFNHQNTHFSLAEYQGNTVLTSYINFGTYSDCTGYINKISHGQTGIYLSGNGTNTGFFIEDVGAYANSPTYFYDRNYIPLTGENPTIKSLYIRNTGLHIQTGQNLAAYISWGSDGGLGTLYANNGYIKWGGNNNWYIMLTVDSYNGQRNPGGGSQAGFLNWFSGNAFGGISYENCPVGAVGNVEEPYLGTSCDSGFLNLWQRGFPFIECAWQSRGTPQFIAFGDPLVIK